MKYKHKTIISVVVIVVAIIVTIVVQTIEPENQAAQDVLSEYVRYETGNVSLSNGTSIPVYLADTPRVRTRGLSNKTYLPEGEGMLFVFEQPGMYSFWMKDMNFAIDMVWINESGEIVHIESNVAPETYPELFVSSDPALYVLEVNAGFVREIGLRIGMKVEIDL